MNLKRFATGGIALLLVLLLLSACSTPKAAENPTAQKQEPTVVKEDPTAEKLVQTSMDNWRVEYNKYVDFRITFSPGQKCTLEVVKNTRSEGMYTYEIVVDDQTFQNYAIVIMTMSDESKTLQDLKEYSLTHTGVVDPPPFATMKTMEIVPPMTRTLHAVIMPVSPIYVGCMIEGPVEQQVFEVFGPIDIE